METETTKKLGDTQSEGREGEEKEEGEEENDTNAPSEEIEQLNDADLDEMLIAIEKFSIKKTEMTNPDQDKDRLTKKEIREKELELLDATKSEIKGIMMKRDNLTLSDLASSVYRVLQTGPDSIHSIPETVLTILRYQHNVLVMMLGSNPDHKESRYQKGGFKNLHANYLTPPSIYQTKGGEWMIGTIQMTQYFITLIDQMSRLRIFFEKRVDEKKPGNKPNTRTIFTPTTHRTITSSFDWYNRIWALRLSVLCEQPILHLTTESKGSEEIRRTRVRLTNNSLAEDLRSLAKGLVKLATLNKDYEMLNTDQKKMVTLEDLVYIEKLVVGMSQQTLNQETKAYTAALLIRDDLYRFRLDNESVFDQQTQLEIKLISYFAIIFGKAAYFRDLKKSQKEHMNLEEATLEKRKLTLEGDENPQNPKKQTRKIDTKRIPRQRSDSGPRSTAIKYIQRAYNGFPSMRRAKSKYSIASHI